LDALGFHLTSHALTVIQTDGSTEVGSNYFLCPADRTSGPGLQYNGSACGRVRKFAADWRHPSLWRLRHRLEELQHGAVDDLEHGNGNWTSNLTNGAVAGNSTTLQSFETVFHPDLNGDGVIGIPSIAPPAFAMPARNVNWRPSYI
jgi:hypothetical protein